MDKEPVVVTRNASYHPLHTRINKKDDFVSLVNSCPGDVHIRSLNGLKPDCQHSSSDSLTLSATADIFQKNVQLTCKSCNKFPITGKVDLRFKPWPDVRKYSDCLVGTVETILSGEQLLSGLTYRLGKISDKTCRACGASIHPHLPRGTEWRISLWLTNPKTKASLVARRTVRCFVDTSGHTASSFSMTFESPHGKPAIATTAAKVDCKLPTVILACPMTSSPSTPLPRIFLQSTSKPLPPLPSMSVLPSSTGCPAYLTEELSSLLDFENDDVLPTPGLELFGAQFDDSNLLDSVVAASDAVTDSTTKRKSRDGYEDCSRKRQQYSNVLPLDVSSLL